MSETKLLPCPFCGGEAVLEPRISVHKEINRIVCTRCGANSGLHHTLPDAVIRKWNTRKPVERIIERLEEAHRKSEGCPKFEKAFRQVAFEEAIEIIKEGMG